MDVSNYLWKYSSSSWMVSDYSQGRQEISMCLAVLLCEQIREWRCQDIDQVLVHEIIFLCQCIQQQWSARQNCFHLEETVKPTCFSLLHVESKSKATLVPQTNHSQYFSPVEALNLIVDSKPQPIELDNSTIELHVCRGGRKACNHILWILISLLCFLMQFDMTFDVTLRDDSSFGKLTNSCNKKHLIFTFTSNLKHKG